MYYLITGWHIDFQQGVRTITCAEALAFSFVTMSLLGFAWDRAFAGCVQDTDWPGKPCFDTPPYSNEESREAWEKYYEYKGQEWMEMKKAEMDMAIEEGRLKEWTAYQSEPNNFANSNVYTYYLVNDQVTPVSRNPSNDSGFLSIPSVVWIAAVAGIAVAGTAAALLILKKVRLAS